MSVSRQRIASFALSVGALAFIASLIRYLILPAFDLWIQIGLSLGVLGIAVGIFLDPDRIRAFLTGRRARYGSNALLLSLAFTGIVVLVNILVYNNPQRIDLTEDQTYTLTRESELLLEELNQPVLIKGFYTPDRTTAREQIRPLLQEYAQESGGNIEFEFIDPRANPLEADQYGVSRDGSLVVIMGESSQLVELPNEQEITTALVRLANPESRKLYFLTGHGERDLDNAQEPGLNQLSRALKAKSYEIAELNLLVEGTVPEDAICLVIAGPTRPLSEEEVNILSAYMEAGGGLVVMIEPTAASGVDEVVDHLIPYLEEGWGITLRDDLVVDPSSTFVLSGISFRYGAHPITEKMGNLATYFPSARSLAIDEESTAGFISQDGLVFTGNNAWGETNIELIEQENRVELDEGEDFPGPLTLAISAENLQNGGRLVVVGDSDFSANSDFRQLGNGDLAINSIDWASGQEDLISITPRQPTQRQVVPASRQTVVIILLVSVVLVPGSVLLLGGYVWWNRRKRI